MEALFGLLGVIALGTAFICLIRPIARIGITSRRRALLLGVAGLVLGLAGLVLLALAGQREEVRQSQALQPSVGLDDKQSLVFAVTAQPLFAISAAKTETIKGDIYIALGTDRGRPPGMLLWHAMR